MTTAIEDQREAVAIRQLRERLISGMSAAAGEINDAVDRAIQQFAGAKIRAFVPLLVERRARDDLRNAISAAPSPQNAPP
jgi:hypothetical protein